MVEIESKKKTKKKMEKFITVRFDMVKIEYLLDEMKIKENTHN